MKKASAATASDCRSFNLGHSKPRNAAAAAAVLEQCRENGLLIGKGGLYGNCLRVAPPLTLTDEECAEGTAILVDALRAVNGR